MVEKEFKVKISADYSVKSSSLESAKKKALELFLRDLDISIYEGKISNKSLAKSLNWLKITVDNF